MPRYRPDPATQHDSLHLLATLRGHLDQLMILGIEISADSSANLRSLGRL